MLEGELIELSQGVKNARKISAAANAFYRLKIMQCSSSSEGHSSAAIEILLKLVKAGGRAAISSLVIRDAHQTWMILKELEKNSFVKLFETPFRTYVVMTPHGWKVFNELISVLI